MNRDEYRRRRDAARRLPPLSDGRRDPDFDRPRQSLGESVDELRAILGREVFPDLVELRRRLAFVESVLDVRDGR